MAKKDSPKKQTCPHVQRGRRLVGGQQWQGLQEPPLANLHHMSGSGNGLTDRLECPECHGTGEQAIGTLRLGCRFCRGLGYVGDGNEPASQEQEPSAPRPIWEDPALSGVSVCRICFGAGTVLNLGGTGEPTGKLIEMPCPACSAQDGN